MSNFFIDRPVFAWVLTIILSIAGLLAINQLPVEQYPNLAPPVVRISVSYPGASAQTMENTVTQVIEQNMTGLDNLLYMSSQSSNNGKASVTLTFRAGVDPNEAMQQVQNQLQPALRKLPQDVQQQGVNVSKSGDSTLMMLAFVSTDGSMQKEDIADYAITALQDPLSRIDGVGSVDVFSSPYAIRIWLQPAKLNNYHLTTQDVVNAVKTQNAQVAVGQIGGTPSVANQALNATINAQSQLKTPQQFRNILLRVNADGSRVTLGDVAKVEIGSENYDFLSRYNGMPAAGMGITLA
ncbi:MAG: efflux RND transporter permease subunit, partial [Enterobacteriaceae bacterium]